MTQYANKSLVQLEHRLVLDSIQLNGFLSSAYSTKKTRLLESPCLFKYILSKDQRKNLNHDTIINMYGYIYN